MADEAKLHLVRDCYDAFARGDRALIERCLADDFTFSAPPDPQLDRAGFFERCWRQEVYFGWDLE
jgi:ketosteroid isomerase-like protein